MKIIFATPFFQPHGPDRLSDLSAVALNPTHFRLFTNRVPDFITTKEEHQCHEEISAVLKKLFLRIRFGIVIALIQLSAAIAVIGARSFWVTNIGFAGIAGHWPDNSHDEFWSARSLTSYGGARFSLNRNYSHNETNGEKEHHYGTLDIQTIEPKFDFITSKQTHYPMPPAKGHHLGLLGFGLDCNWTQIAGNSTYSDVVSAVGVTLPTWFLLPLTGLYPFLYFRRLNREKRLATRGFTVIPEAATRA